MTSDAGTCVAKILLSKTTPISPTACGTTSGSTATPGHSGQGEDALARFRVRVPDRIVLDLMLPNLDGYQVYDG